MQIYVVNSSQAWIKVPVRFSFRGGLRAEHPQPSFQSQFNLESR